MSKNQTYKKCKNFDTIYCPHRENQIMKKAAPELPEYHGGNYQTLPLPNDEQINKTCKKCDSFILK